MTPSAHILLVAGTSCAGKDAVVGQLLSLRPEIRKVVTTTTRPRRDYEEDGVHYHFLSDDAFDQAVREGDFLEWAHVHDHRYGLTRSELARVRADGGVPLAIMDVQGVRTVASQLRTVRVFVTAPMDQVEARLRRSRPAAEIASRLASARIELLEASDYDLVLQNPDGGLDGAVADLLDFYDAGARARFLGTPGPATRAMRQG